MESINQDDESDKGSDQEDSGSDQIQVWSDHSTSRRGHSKHATRAQAVCQIERNGLRYISPISSDSQSPACVTVWLFRPLTGLGPSLSRSNPAINLLASTTSSTRELHRWTSHGSQFKGQYGRIESNPSCLTQPNELPLTANCRQPKQDNFDIVLALLEEMMASGRPLLSQASQLRELVMPPSQLLAKVALNAANVAG